MRTEPGTLPAAGFTLLELAIVASVLAILALAAMPAWRSHVLRSHRAEARAALLALGTAQEKHYLLCGSYALVHPSAGTTCEPSVLRFPEWSSDKRYRIEVTSADESTWTATATAVDQQAGDSACVELGLSAEGGRTARRADGSENGIQCWNR